MQILCSHVTASVETRCVIPMRALAAINVYARVHARVSSFPFLRREKRKVDIPHIAGEGRAALSFGRNLSAFSA